jgi:putative salt-induced outer membrane protein YdiY
MVRYSFFLLFFSAILFAQNNVDTNETAPIEDTQHDPDAPMIIKDQSGLSEEEIRQKANKLDKKKEPVKIKDVIEAIDDNGEVELKKLAKKEWEDLAPTPKDGYDWIKTQYGDWLKGHIKGMFDDKLEFDSQEFGIYTFKIGDIAEIRSYGVMSVNIDNVAIFKGIIRYKDKKITIISGDHSYTFDKKMIISIASAQDKERYYWSADITFNMDVRQGNNNQADVSLQVNLKRRTPKNRLMFNYLGRYSEANDIKTAEDNRASLSYDRFINKRFFITPAIGEFYQNYFQNIKRQTTLGLGVGYTLYDTSQFDWDIGMGPAMLEIVYYEATFRGILDEKSASFQGRSRLEYKFTTLSKVIFNYQFSFMEEKAGKYRHHSETKFEYDFVKDRIFVDVNFIWDYVESPQELEDGSIPLQSDFQTLVGAGIRF